MSVDNLPVINAVWQAPTNVHAFNTTRLGGVSASPYDSLNLGLHVKDDAASVYENRARLQKTQSLPSEPHWLNQVHGCEVLDLTTQSHSSNTTQTTQAAHTAHTAHTADAAFTNQQGDVLCVLTADCLPVVITNQQGTELAVAHAGWKGLINGVLEASLEKFSPTERFHIWFGPAIGPEKFEVGLEVKEAFVAKCSMHEQAFSANTSDASKAYANIYTLAQQTIEQHMSCSSSVVSFSGGDRCTMSEGAHFHSYRRDGAASGRMALVAWLAP